MRTLFALLCLVATVSCFTHYAVLRNVYQTHSSSASGTGIALFDLSVNTLSWWVIHNVSASLTAGHIHGPAFPGKDAPAVITFMDPASPIVGSMVINTELATWINSGQAYVNIHTSVIPQGAIRGQILNRWQAQVALTGDQEVPKVNTVRKGQAFYTYDMMTKTFTYILNHNVINVTQAHIHGPAGVQTTAPVLVPLTKKTNQQFAGTIVFDAMMEMHFMNGMLYFNVHSQKVPSGEVRAQLMPPAMFAAGLTGWQEVPPVDTMAIGLAIGWRMGATDQWLRVIAAHTVMNATAAHVHAPAMPGMIAPPFLFLEPAWISDKTIMLDTNSSMWLETHMMYVNVHSGPVSSGEVRGQLYHLE